MSGRLVVKSTTGKSTTGKSAAAMSRRKALAGGAALAAAGVLAKPFVANAQAADNVKYTLDFRIYGANSQMFFGVEKGIFKDLNLNLAIDGSAGSGDSVARIASGTHDCGMVDMSTLAEFAGRNPDAAPIAVLTVYDRMPACVLSLKDRKPVTSFKDLVGLKLGTGQADAASRLFPALCTVNKIERASVLTQTVDVKLRETLLLRGDVDALLGFDYTMAFNLVDAGQKLENINILYYTEAGFDFPGASFCVSRAMFEKNPDLARRLTVGTARAWQAGIRDPQGSTDAVMKRERMLNPAIEKVRLEWVHEKLVLTPRARKDGFGDVAPERLSKGLAFLSESLKFDKPPTADQIFSRKFLPELKDREA